MVSVKCFNLNISWSGRGVCIQTGLGDDNVTVNSLLLVKLKPPPFAAKFLGTAGCASKVFISHYHQVSFSSASTQNRQKGFISQLIPLPRSETTYVMFVLFHLWLISKKLEI